MSKLLFCLAVLFVTFKVAAQNDAVWNLEPTQENPRNSEGAFVTLKSGKILFLYTQFFGGARDESPARIVSIESEDQGRTWQTAPKTEVDNEGGANVMSVSLLRLKNGKIALFYLRKNNWLDCRAYVRFSNDECQTWSDARLAGSAPGYFVVNNDRIIQLSSGRLVMPLAFHRSRDTDPQSSKSFDSRAITMWFFSDDEGQIWKESSSWWAAPLPSRTGLQEPGVVELPEGSLFSWMRTDLGSLYGSESKDGGKTWTAPTPTPLKSPVSPASIKVIPGTKTLLAVYNDHSGDFSFPIAKRTPLVIALSADGGKTWTHKRAIETDPEGWYCYTAIHFTSEFVLLAYCAGDPKVGGLNRLRIRRLPLAGLSAEKVK
jgi:hypothetical protein